MIFFPVYPQIDQKYISAGRATKTEKKMDSFNIFFDHCLYPCKQRKTTNYKGVNLLYFHYKVVK